MSVTLNWEFGGRSVSPSTLSNDIPFPLPSFDLFGSISRNILLLPPLRNVEAIISSELVDKKLGIENVFHTGEC